MLKVRLGETIHYQEKRSILQEGVSFEDEMKH